MQMAQADTPQITLGDKMTPEDAAALFASLPAVEMSEMIGTWRGSGIATGHKLEGLLNVGGWVGKRFDSAEAVYPLVNSSILGQVYLNPGLVPFRLMTALNVASWPLMKAVFFCLNPLFRTTKPRARLRMMEHDGVMSAAMIYDQLAMIDHFRRVDANCIMGKMDHKGDETPLFFRLDRADG